MLQFTCLTVLRAGSGAMTSRQLRSCQPFARLVRVVTIRHIQHVWTICARLMPVASPRLPPINASARRATTDLGLPVSPPNARLEPFNSKNHVFVTLALSASHVSPVEMKMPEHRGLDASAKRAGQATVNCAFQWNRSKPRTWLHFPTLTYRRANQNKQF